MTKSQPMNLLVRYRSVSVHVRNLQILAIEMFKSPQGLISADFQRTYP